MDNPLFDGQGIEFHHLQRAKLSEQQAQSNRQQVETNRLLREQNDLLKRAEQERDREREERERAEKRRKKQELNDSLPKCCYCNETLNEKAVHCPKCNCLLRWRTCQKPVGARGGLNAGERGMIWVIDPFSCPQCSGIIVAKSTPCVHCGTTLRWKSGEAHAMAKEPPAAESPTRSSIQELPQGTPSGDPSGIGEWFASEVLCVMACIAVADRKLRSSEVAVMSSVMKSLCLVLNEEELTLKIVAACKEISKADLSIALRKSCDKLQGLKGTPPAAFLLKCAESVSRSNGPASDPEDAILSALRESLGGLEINPDDVDGLAVDLLN